MSTPIVLVPGLACSSHIYAPVVPHLWQFGAVMVANHIRDDSMGAIAKRILAEAPPRFALAGHSMGGYIAFEIMRQAPERVTRLALINTQARPDTPEASEKRRALVAAAKADGVHAVIDTMFPLLVHPSRTGEAGLRQLFQDMCDDVGIEGFIRNQTAIVARQDSRPTMGTIRCPTLVLTGDQDNIIPNSLSAEMADGIVGAELVTIPGCGHCPQPERPQAAVAALTQWLQM